MKKSQVATEFIIVLGFAIMLMMIMLVIITDSLRSMNTEKEYNTVRDFGLGLQHELLIASDVKDGYNRKVFLPQEILSYDYTISNTDSEIVIFSQPSNIEHVFHIPYTNGTFVKGQNIITKSGGVVYLNQ